jgi:hypothetical protein
MEPIFECSESSASAETIANKARSDLSRWKEVAFADHG